MLALHCRSWETSNSELTARAGFSCPKKWSWTPSGKSWAKSGSISGQWIQSISNTEVQGLLFLLAGTLFFSDLRFQAMLNMLLTRISYSLNNDSELLPWGCWWSSEHWSIMPDVMNFGWSAMCRLYIGCLPSIHCLEEYPILSGTVRTECRSVFRVFLCTKSEIIRVLTPGLVTQP